MKTRILLATVGTLACLIAGRLKKAVAKNPASYNPVRFVAIDSGWDAEDTSCFTEGERVDLAGFPLQDLRENPDQWGDAFADVQTDQLDIGVDILDAGPLIPATVFAAVIGKWSELQEKISAGLQELLAHGEGDDIEAWAVGSVPSTTGRAGLIPLQFCLRDCLRLLGQSNPVVNAVVLDSEGLRPDRLEERRLIEAGYWRESERAVESSPERPVRRRYANSHWTSGRPALFTFRRNGKRQTSNLASVRELADTTTDWLLTTVLNPIVHRHVTSLRGDRARVLARIGAPDGHRFDPKRRYLSVAGSASIDLAIPSLKAYVGARAAEFVVKKLIGEVPTQVGQLATELQLNHGALSQRLGDGPLVAQVNRELNRLDQTLDKEKHVHWRRHVVAAQINLDTHLDHARRGIPAARLTVVTELTDRIAQRTGQLLVPPADRPADEVLRQATGVQGTIAYLEDIGQQLDKVRKECEKELTTAYPLASCHSRVAELLANVNYLESKTRKKGAVLAELRRGYGDAVRVVIVDHVLRTVDEFQAFVTEQLNMGREVLSRLTEAANLCNRAKEAAMAPSGGVLARRLLESEADFDRLVTTASLLEANTVETAKSAVLETIAAGGPPLAGLAACSAERLLQLAGEVFTCKAQLDVQLQQHFRPCFEMKFDSPTAQGEALRWLLDAASPLGGSLMPGFEQKVPAHARPAFINHRKVLLPPDMLDLAKQHLGPAGLSPEAIVVIEDLPMIVCVHEKHGLPAYAFPYLANIASQLPVEPKHRGRFVTDKGALEYLPELTPHEPFRGCSDEELVHAGVIAGVVARNGNGGLVLTDKAGLPIALGSTLAECARALAAKTCRDELMQILLEKLTNLDLNGAVQGAVQADMLPLDHARAIHQRLLRVQEWTQRVGDSSGAWRKS